MQINNPIIPGFYPDPSIIRVDDDFYIIHSSFEYFPAIPLWHSKDLKHWRQIGHVIDRASQGLDLSDVACSGGVQAATIRYHHGTFYVTSTRIKTEWPSLDYHFVVTTQDIEGPWSDCHFIEQAPGIDSALFFEQDRAYFLANRETTEATSKSDSEIWLQELDLSTFRLIGEPTVLWAGTGGLFPEGPRLYKRDGFYYLLIAEGGTLHYHTVTVARSQSLRGPYQSSLKNPLLTHKHLSRTYPIQNVGHADIVDLPDGTSVGVCLGSRPRGGFYDGGNMKYTFGGYYRNLGRETFLFPVEWPADLAGPLLSPNTGKIETSYVLEGLKEHPLPDAPLDFSDASLALKWVTIKQESKAHVKVHANRLSLTLSNNVESSFIGIRQTSWQARYDATIDVSQLNEGRAIWTAWISYQSYIGIEWDAQSFTYFTVYNGKKTVHKKESLASKKMSLGLKIVDQDYTFFCGEHSSYTIDGRSISCDLNDAHTGVMIGFSGQSKASETLTLSDFRYLDVASDH